MGEQIYLEPLKSAPGRSVFHYYLMQKSMGFNNVAIVYVKWSAYRIHFWRMSKDDAINRMNGLNLGGKRGVL